MGLSERKNIRRSYGFDEVAIVPGSITINPEITDTSIDIAGVNLTIPILASAMDAIVSPSFSVLMNKFLISISLKLVGNLYLINNDFCFSIISFD